jgi:hypothetical protein
MQRRASEAGLYAQMRTAPGQKTGWLPIPLIWSKPQLCSYLVIIWFRLQIVAGYSA